MSKGKRIKKIVLDLVARESLANPNVDRRLLAIELRHRIELMGEIPPTEETLIKMISNYRSKQPDDLDKPWTLAESVSRAFPVETTPFLLRIWRYSQAIDAPFSIRQAKWASYLGTVISNITDLYTWSDEYARYERGYALRQLDFTSCDLDGALMMTELEHAAAALLGKLIPVPILGGGNLKSPPSLNHYIEDAYAAARIAEFKALFVLRSKHPDQAQAIRDSCDNDWDVLPTLKELELTEEQIWAYVHWLTALCEGPKWRDMKRNEALNNIKRLRKWISEDLPAISQYLTQTILDLRRRKEKISFRDFPYRLELIPHDLVHKAGFTTESPDNLPGQWLQIINRVSKLKIPKETTRSSNKTSTVKTHSREEL